MFSIINKLSTFFLLLRANFLFNHQHTSSSSSAPQLVGKAIDIDFELPRAITGSGQRFNRKDKSLRGWLKSVHSGAFFLHFYSIFASFFSLKIFFYILLFYLSVLKKSPFLTIFIIAVHPSRP